MLVNDLKSRVQELDGQIDRLKKEMAPMKERLDRLLETRRLAADLLEMENGTAAKIIRIGRAVRRNRKGEPIWSVLAADHNYEVGTNSAHRVVADRDPALHASIDHQNCAVDKRSYP